VSYAEQEALQPRLVARIKELESENADLRLDLRVAHRAMQKVVGDMETLRSATIKLLKVLESKDGE
jgi:transcriptional antiterminator